MEKIVIEIPQFVRKLQVSKKQKAIHYEWNGIKIKAKGRQNIPKSFFRNDGIYPGGVEVLAEKIENLKEIYYLGYLYKKEKVRLLTRNSSITPSLTEQKGKYVLCRKEEEEFIPVISNLKKVGTPRFYLIKGQDIYSGNLREHFKGFVMTEIKKCYRKYVQNIPVINEYPIKIEAELHDTIKNPYHNIKGEHGSHWDIDNYVYPYMKAFPDLLVELGKLKDDDRLHLTQSIGVKFIPIDNHEDRKLVFIISLDDRAELEGIKAFHNNPIPYKPDGGFENEITRVDYKPINLEDLDKLPY